MVDLRFNMHRIFFESGLDTIEHGYSAAVSGITQEINNKKAASYDYARHLENGGSPTEERDDEGYLIWSEDQNLESDIEIAEEALMVMRKSYAITIYHHWERSALQWTGKTKERHDNLVDLVRRIGYPIDDQLASVQFLANLLKHANGHWGRKLFQSWPELFPASFNQSLDSSSTISWYDQVSLSDTNIKQIFDAVRRSGPRGMGSLKA